MLLNLVKPCNWTIIKFLSGLPTSEERSSICQIPRTNARFQRTKGSVTLRDSCFKSAKSSHHNFKPDGSLLSARRLTYPTQAKAAVVTVVMHLNSFFHLLSAQAEISAQRQPSEIIVEFKSVMMNNF